MLYQLSNFKVDRKRPLRDQIYPMIRMLILTGAIKPGDVIDEKAMAAHLNVSRTPVREAVKRLSDEHLVEVVAQSATRATRIDRKEIDQAFMIRRALEMESAAQAATRITPEQADKLSEILALHARAMERKKFSDAIGFDDRFHRYITEISDLPLLWHSIEISKAQLDRCRHMMIPRPGEADTTLEHHRKIIRALNSKDPENARKAMSNHLEVAYQNTIAVLEGPGLNPV